VTDARAARVKAAEERAFVSPEAAAVIIAADRVADLPTSEFMVASRAMFRAEELNPAILRLREAVAALRLKRVDELAKL
jgi:hypothetical protein